MAEGANLRIDITANSSGAVAAIDLTKAKIADLYATMDVLKARQSELISKAAISAANVEIEKTAQQIDGLSSGFKGAGNASDQFLGKISQQRVALVDAGRIITGTGFTVRSLGSQLQLFSIGTLAAIAGIALLAAGIYHYATAATDAEAAQKLLNQTLGESEAGVQGEVAQIKDLISIVGDESNSREVRSRAFKELQDQYPNAFKNMDLEKTSLKDLTIVTDRLTDALVRQAQIKGIESAIADVAKEQAQLLSDTGAEVLKNAGIWGTLDAVIKNVEGLNYRSIATISLATQTDALSAKTAKLKEQLDSINKTKFTNDDDELLGKDKGGDTKQLQDKNISYLKQVKSITESFSKDKPPLFKAFEESSQGFLGPVNEKLYADELQKAMEDAAKGYITSDTFHLIADAIGDAHQREANPDLTSKITTQIDTSNFVAPDVENETKKLQKSIPPLTLTADIDFRLAKQEAAAFAVQISKTLTTGINSALTNVAEAVGGALGSGKNVLQTAGSALLKSIGGLLEDLGRGLIELGGIKVALQSLSLSGPVAIALGVAAEIVGAALVSSSATHAFAEGGIVTGPTNALIGEAGPEVVFPLDKLNNFIRGGAKGAPNNINITSSIRGTDLLMAVNRATKQQGFV